MPLYYAAKRSIPQANQKSSNAIGRRVAFCCAVTYHFAQPQESRFTPGSLFDMRCGAAAHEVLCAQVMLEPAKAERVCNLHSARFRDFKVCNPKKTTTRESRTPRGHSSAARTLNFAVSPLVAHDITAARHDLCTPHVSCTPHESCTTRVVMRRDSAAAFDCERVSAAQSPPILITLFAARGQFANCSIVICVNTCDCAAVRARTEKVHEPTRAQSVSRAHLAASNIA